jgi:hypothetical protein
MISGGTGSLSLGTAMVLLLAWFALGCTSPKEVQKTMVKTERTLAMAHNVNASLCAPVELANAETAVIFAKIEFRQGYLRRGSEHIRYAHDMAETALTMSKTLSG